jgi:hypothetical protein
MTRARVRQHPSLPTHQWPPRVTGQIFGERPHDAAKVVENGLIGLQVFEFKGDKGEEDWIQVAKCMRLLACPFR